VEGAPDAAHDPRGAASELERADIVLLLCRRARVITDNSAIRERGRAAFGAYG
jgi:hypothetical protein